MSVIDKSLYIVIENKYSKMSFLIQLSKELSQFVLTLRMDILLDSIVWNRENYLSTIYISNTYACRKNFHFMSYWFKKWLNVDGKSVVEFNTNMNGPRGQTIRLACAILWNCIIKPVKNILWSFPSRYSKVEFRNIRLNIQVSKECN